MDILSVFFACIICTLITVILLHVLVKICYLVSALCFKDRKNIPTFISNQDDDVWNISSRVNHETQGSAANPSTNWPTHDTHVSIDNIVLNPEYVAKDRRPPPPPYSELDLPTYEQATGCRLPKPDLAVVHIAGSSGQRNNPGSSSS